MSPKVRGFITEDFIKETRIKYELQDEKKENDGICTIKIIYFKKIYQGLFDDDEDL